MRSCHSAAQHAKGPTCFGAHIQKELLDNPVIASSAALAERYWCLPRETSRFWNVQGQGSRGAAHGGGRSQTDRAAQLQEDLQACAEGASHDSGKRNLTSSPGQHVRCLHQGMSCWLTLTDVAEQSLAISAINRHYCSRKAPHTCLSSKLIWWD